MSVQVRKHDEDVSLEAKYFRITAQFADASRPPRSEQTGNSVGRDHFQRTIAGVESVNSRKSGKAIFRESLPNGYQHRAKKKCQAKHVFPVELLDLQRQYNDGTAYIFVDAHGK